MKSISNNQFREKDEESASFSLMKTDQDEWLEFLSGSSTALSVIYTKYVPILYNYGKNLINNESLVRDSIQDVFFKLIDRRKQLSPVTSVKFYLITSFRRTLLRLISRDKKYIAQQKDDKGFTYILDPEIINISTNHTINEKQFILEACNRLPKRQREAIMLFFFDEFSYKEIAEIMNFSNPKNARTIIYRALNTLSEKLMVLKDELI